MWKDARDKYPELYNYDYSEAEIKKMKFKISNDPRVTRVGFYLRMISLDELPNLINVLKGDMNLIGPRPEIPEMIKYYKPHQMKKFNVKPGISGLAQVNGRGLLTFQKTIQYDLWYVKKKTLCLDAYLFWRTLSVVVKAIGAY
jgi:lipopolysaccharide/colanic/teichoic acid biosynthesis glycosyltransferase